MILDLSIKRGVLQGGSANSAQAGMRVLTEQAPVVWQEVGGQRIPVTAAYRIAPDGSGTDIAEAIALDSSGNAYVTGYTSSTNFPTVSSRTRVGGTEVFVTKLTTNGSSLTYSTYLGGSSTDVGQAITVASDGSALV